MLRRTEAGDAAGPGRAGLALLATLVVAAVALRLEGRPWLCTCGRFVPWIGDAWGAETSQQLFDPYTFTHVLHGFLLWWALGWCLPRLDVRRRLVLAVAAEALWEVFENTDFVIRRYRAATAALGYEGDTVVNSLGDVLACAVGVLLARRLGSRRTLAAFVAIELALLSTIRDGLLLNVLLLVWPVDWIKAWQAGR